MFLLKSVLYIVGIPIGNIFDFSQRSVFILKNADIIATEDTRKAGFLLKFLNIKQKLISLNNFNEIAHSYILLNFAKNGASIALISDSGTPVISDPGYFLINLFYKNYLRVIPVPGISAFSSALSISGFDVSNFIFDGFLPKNLLYRKIILDRYLFECRVVVFFETSVRLISTLFLMRDIFQKNRRLFILKDISKVYENYLFIEIGSIKSLDLDRYISFFFKGEFVLLLEGFKKSTLHTCFILFINSLLHRDRYFYSILNKSKISKNLFYFYIF